MPKDLKEIRCKKTKSGKLYLMHRTTGQKIRIKKNDKTDLIGQLLIRQGFEILTYGLCRCGNSPLSCCRHAPPSPSSLEKKEEKKEKKEEEKKEEKKTSHHEGTKCNNLSCRDGPMPHHLVYRLRKYA